MPDFLLVSLHGLVFREPGYFRHPAKEQALLADTQTTKFFSLLCVNKGVDARLLSGRVKRNNPNINILAGWTYETD